MMTNHSHLISMFSVLTERQRETMVLLSEGRTSKEIANLLGVSESAVVQRIETVRSKAGGLLRKDLARVYRTYMAASKPEAVNIPAQPVNDQWVAPAAGAELGWFAVPAQRNTSCNDLTGKFFQLPQHDANSQTNGRHHAVDELVMADAIPFEIASPWASRSQPVVVPEVLDGKSAALMRLLAATGLALALLATCLVLLAVASEIGELV